MWERSLFYYLSRLSKSEADTWDLLQETWLKVFRSLKKIRDPRTFPAFLYTTARNAAITRIRRSTPELLDIAEHGENTSTDCAFLAFDDAEQVHHALDRLPLLHREAVTLYFLEDLSMEQIAEVLGVPVGTVKSRLHYGKQLIREIITNGEHHGNATRPVSRSASERAAHDARTA